MELLIFGSGGPRVMVFPSREQRFFEYEDRGMVHSLRSRLDAGELQLFCVDGVDSESLYCFAKPPEERLARQLQYEQYIIDEAIPFSAAMNPAPLTAHGCSLGAYQAVTLALRNPQLFKKVVAFSGRYDLTLATGEFYSLFDGYEGESLNGMMPSLFSRASRSARNCARSASFGSSWWSATRIRFAKTTPRSRGPSPRKKCRTSCTSGAATRTASDTGGRW